MRIPSILLSLALTGAACSTSNDQPMAEDPTTPAAPSTETAKTTPAAGSLYELEAPALDGSKVDLSDYNGKVSLVVNVASRCGYTRQYAGLQALHAELAPRGFQVLAFPSNDFGGQEPGSPEEIREFCDSNYGVTFPMFGKVATKGPEQSPIYANLEKMTGELPGWNFCKYLIGKDGKAIGFWNSGTAPDAAELRKAIDEALGS